MENIPLLKDIVILMAVSVPMSLLLTRAGLPTIIGFLMTGVIIGPYGFGLVTDIESVEVLAQIGVVLLLFTIGLEFSVAKMLNLRREGILGGGLQVALTVLVVLAAGLYLTGSFTVSLLLGFIISLSSTAIVLKLLLDRAEVNSPHGNFTVGILLFQDICVVLMFMVIRGIGTDGGGGALETAKELGVSLAAFGAIVAGVGYVIPRLFDQVVRLRNREVFILTILLVCMGTAWLTSLFGLSLAIGAFIAGLAISESEYSNQITADVIPFRDAFASLFFISIGMLLDLGFLIGHVPLIASLVAAVIVLKTVVVVAAGRLLKRSLRLTLAVGLSLAQVGEFSFILIKMGRDYNILNEGYYQALLAVSIISMALTPLLFVFSSRAASSATRMLSRVRGARGHADGPLLSNHIIIVGYGLIGRNLARVLSQTAVPHLVVEINADRLREARDAGHTAYFGDISHPEILRKMGTEKAKMLVVVISDPISTRRAVKSAREMNPALSILVRTRYTREVEDLYRLGADQVIPEEFETSVEIFARVLKDYRIPGNIVQNQIDLIRDEGYAMLRNPSMSSSERLNRLTSVLEQSLTDTFYVEPESRVAEKTLSELDIRKKSGASIIAVIRNGKAKTNPGAGFRVEHGDILVVLGSHAELNSAMDLLLGRDGAQAG